MSKVTFDTLRKIANKLPGVEDGAAFGKQALKVDGKLLACVPSHKSAEPDSLALPIDPDDRAELIAAAPEVYYAPEHYLSYPMVLVRLSRVDPGVLRDLLGMAHRYVTTHPPHKRSPGKAARSAVKKSAISFDTVRKIGLALPGVEEGTSYGSPALKIGGKMFACVPSHKSAEVGSLAIRIDFEQRAELLAADPETYYITEHYLNYPAVLLRLSRATPDMLRDLLGTARRFVLQKK